MTKALSGIDGEVRLTKTDLSYLDTVEQAIGEAIKHGDATIAVNFMDKMRKVAQLQGIGLAMMLSRLEESWESVFVPSGMGDDFFDFIYDRLGYTRQTSKKYIRMWRAVFENTSIPKPLRDKLKSKGIDTLLLLTATAQDGDFEENDWKEVAVAPNKQEVRDLIRKKRGERTSSGSAKTIILERDGTLKAQVDGDWIEIGWLNMNSESAGMEAIDRIVRAAGIVER